MLKKSRGPEKLTKYYKNSAILRIKFKRVPKMQHPKPSKTIELLKVKENNSTISLSTIKPVTLTSKLLLKA